MKITMATGPCGTFPVVAPGAHRMYRTRFHALINLIGIDLPENHRMRMSASEP